MVVQMELYSVGLTVEKMDEMMVGDLVVVMVDWMAVQWDEQMVDW